MAKLFKLGGKSRREIRSDWYAKIRLGPYRFKRVRLCTDKATSERWAGVLQAAVDRQQGGEPPDREALRDVPRRLLESLTLVSALAAKRRGSFTENVEDYVSELKTAGRNPAYVRNVEGLLAAVGKACNWKKLTDVTRDSIVDYLTDRKATDTAPRTLNNIRSTINGFARWCVDSLRLDSNPCEHVKRTEQNGDKRRVRRALTRAEVGRLLKAAPRREFVYRMALATGLRKSELKRLQWRDVRID